MMGEFANAVHEFGLCNGSRLALSQRVHLFSQSPDGCGPFILKRSREFVMIRTGALAGFRLVDTIQ